MSSAWWSRFGAWLQKVAGLRKGDRVAIMMPNILQYPIAIMGTHRAGCVVVNVNPLYTARELEHQLKDSGASVCIVLESFAATLYDTLANDANTKRQKAYSAAMWRGGVYTPQIIVDGITDVVGSRDEVGQRVLRVEVVARLVRLEALDIDAQRGA